MGRKNIVAEVPAKYGSKNKAVVWDMSHKSVGTKGEREIVKMFWDSGWAAIRAPGSGSARFPSPDIIAGRGNRKIVIEAKMTKEDKKYFEAREIEELKKFGMVFGAEIWVAVKFRGMSWLFINTEDLNKSEKSYIISKEGARTKGLLFEEIIK